MCFECFKNTFFLHSVSQVCSWIAASVRLCLPGCCFLVLGEQKEAGWSLFSPRVIRWAPHGWAPHGWAPLNPAAFQGLLPAPKALLVKEKFLPAQWPVTLRGAALCHCGLTGFLQKFCEARYPFAHESCASRAGFAHSFPAQQHGALLGF